MKLHTGREACASGQQNAASNLEGLLGVLQGFTSSLLCVNLQFRRTIILPLAMVAASNRICLRNCKFRRAWEPPGDPGDLPDPLSNETLLAAGIGIGIKNFVKKKTKKQGLNNYIPKPKRMKMFVKIFGKLPQTIVVEFA